MGRPWCREAGDGHHSSRPGSPGPAGISHTACLTFSLYTDEEAEVQSVSKDAQIPGETGL